MHTQTVTMEERFHRGNYTAHAVVHTKTIALWRVNTRTTHSYMQTRYHSESETTHMQGSGKSIINSQYFTDSNFFLHVTETVCHPKQKTKKRKTKDKQRMNVPLGTTRECCARFQLFFVVITSSPRPYAAPPFLDRRGCPCRSVEVAARSRPS